MRPSDSKPWWEKVNDYLSFEERDEFLRGASAYRPSQEMDIIIGMMKAGYVKKAPQTPQSYTGKKQS